MRSTSDYLERVPRTRTANTHLLKIASLFALTIQNSALVLLMKYSFRQSGDEYSAASVVVTAELLKLFFCSVYIIFRDGHKQSLKAFKSAPREFGLVLPCVLYVVQNNLLFEAVHNLPTSMYVVCSQGKIITSAVFSFVLLGAQISRKQITALFILALGVIMVQMPVRDARESTTHKDKPKVVRGLVAVAIACCSSGYAGVYLEKVYKERKYGNSVWSRNLQLSFYSLPLSMLLAVKNGTPFTYNGFFSGFDSIVVTISILQAGGGIITALVMRYASTILKCFAVSLSICICTVVSILFGQENLTLRVVFGTTLVNCAIFLYST